MTFKKEDFEHLIYPENDVLLDAIVARTNVLLSLVLKRIEQLEVENKHLRTLALNPLVVNQYDENQKLRAANEVLRGGLDNIIARWDRVGATTGTSYHIAKEALESADKIMKGE